MLGEGSGGILAALPMPLGSLIELLTPPMLPGPCGIPLTPASCARDFIGAVKLATNAKTKKADLPNIGRSPVKVPNEPAGSPFPVRMLGSRQTDTMTKPSGAAVVRAGTRWLTEHSRATWGDNKNASLRDR
jgi:hypothetical protein